MDPFASFLIFAALGFAAQMVDGSLGMAYGVSLNTLMLSLGISPVNASASVHLAEVATTLFSGISHFKLGNVDRSLFIKLVVPGTIGGAIGAYVLSSLPGEVIKPFIALYLALMGAMILYRARNHKDQDVPPIHPMKAIVLGFIGAVCDAIGGGGWGPVVTSTLIARGEKARFTIGSVNLAEFCVTVAESAVFLYTLQAGFLAENWIAIAGIMMGGMIAAPSAAYVCKRAPTKLLMFIVGTLIILLSARTILMSLSII